MQSSGILYQYRSASSKKGHRWTRKLGMGILALALGGISGPLLPAIRLETNYAYREIFLPMRKDPVLPKSVPVLFNPLKTEDGSSIDPINTDFSLVVPKIGINAAVIPAVNPTQPNEYLEALEKGVAHASTSF